MRFICLAAVREELCAPGIQEQQVGSGPGYSTCLIKGSHFYLHTVQYRINTVLYCTGVQPEYRYLIKNLPSSTHASVGTETFQRGLTSRLSTLASRANRQQGTKRVSRGLAPPSKSHKHTVQCSAHAEDRISVWVRTRRYSVNWLTKLYRTEQNQSQPCKMVSAKTPKALLFCCLPGGSFPAYQTVSPFCPWLS
jgi:hypothetical protein